MGVGVSDPANSTIGGSCRRQGGSRGEPPLSSRVSDVGPGRDARSVVVGGRVSVVQRVGGGCTTPRR